MADQAPDNTTVESLTQLSQARVPIEEADDVLSSKDASGRTPIVVMTVRPFRIQSLFLILALAVIVGSLLGAPILNFDIRVILPLAIVIALALVAAGIYRGLHVRIPEGTNALLTRGGKYVGTLDSGPHVIPPWLTVSRLVTRRQIPFDAPVADAPTQDSVFATMDALVTFVISDPYKFVYSISASDFDHVFQAECQYVLRSMIRSITSDHINDLVRRDTDDLMAQLSEAADPYGVTIQKLTITYARPPEDFVRSQEARQLAVFQREQQVEEQMLAQRRQASQEALDRQHAIAQVAREGEELQAQLQQAEMRKEVTEREMQAQTVRLSKLQELLDRYPHAAEWEWQGQQLEVARALAGNTRAVLQVGNAGDIVRALMLRQFAAEMTEGPVRDNRGLEQPTAPAS